MCVVMCVGLALLGLLVFAARQCWVLRRTGGGTELSALVVAVLAEPMVVWMRFRGMEWRPTLEMAAPARRRRSDGRWPTGLASSLR
jgi:hypothetical protein